MVFYLHDFLRGVLSQIEPVLQLTTCLELVMTSIGSLTSNKLSVSKYKAHMRMLGEVSEKLDLENIADAFVTLALHDLEAFCEITKRYDITSESLLVRLAYNLWKKFDGQSLSALPGHIESLCLDILSGRIPEEAFTRVEGSNSLRFKKKKTKKRPKKR